jgi:hypothetical protein
MTLFKPRVRPSLTSPTVFNAPAPTTAITDLDPGTDYRVVMPSTPYNGRLWLRGGRKVHIGWGATPAAYGGEIRETSSGRACLLVEDMEECWIEGLALYKFDAGGVPIAGNGIQIRCATRTFPVYILNCFIDGTGGLNGLGGSSAICVNNSDAGEPAIVVDGLTCRSFETGITGNSVTIGSYSSLDLTRVNISWGTGLPRNTGTLIEIPATATFFETYIQDDAAPTAAIAGLVTGEDTTDVAGNLVFRPSLPLQNGVIHKGAPSGGDWVPEAETGLNYVAPGYETGAPLPTVSSSRLLYHPDFVVPLTSPTTTNVGSSGGTVTLGSGDHRIITLNAGTGAVTGNVTVNGIAGSGNRIRIIGGQITNATEDATSASHCLRINNVDYVYIEGVKGSKADTAGDFINLAGTWKLVVIQNCRGEGMNTRDTALGHAFTQHGDFFQAQTRGGLILMDRCTGDTWNQGIILDSSLSPPSADPNSEGVVLSRVNMRVNDTALNPIQPADSTHPLFYLQNCCGTSCRIPVWLTDVWGVDEQAISPSTIAQMVAPSASFGTAPCGANYDADLQRVTWPVANKITGYIAYGIPSGGDFVPSTFTGLDYVTPGYAGVPIPTVQRGTLALTLDHTPTVQELVQAAAANRATTAPTLTDPAWANRQIATDGAWAEHGGTSVRLPAQAAPAALLAPTARADTFNGGTVGSETAIAFSNLTANDLFDPRTRSLVVSSAGSTVGCTVTVDDDSVNVTPSQQSPVSFSATVQDSKGNTSSATVTVTGVTAAPPPPVTPTDWYGNPFTATGLANVIIGRGTTTGCQHRRAYIPFRPTVSKSIAGMRWYNIKQSPDYALGTGGTADIRICASTGSGSAARPTDTQIGSGVITITDVRSRGTWARYAFSTPVPVVANTLYYLRYVNTHPQDCENDYGVDILSANWNTTGTITALYSPFFGNEDLACYYRNGATGSLNLYATRQTNATEFDYTDGTYHSLPYMEQWGQGSNAPEQNAVRDFTTSLWHRQRFTPSADMTLTHFACASRVITGSGNVIAEVRRPYGTVLRTITIPSTAFGSPSAGTLFCTPIALSSPLAVSQGVEFFVTLRASTGSFRSVPFRCGGKAGFGYHAIVNGHCEYSLNSGSSWSTGWPSIGGSVVPQADLPMAFRIA